MFEEVAKSNKTVNPINTYSVVPRSLTLDSTPTKMLKKRRNTRRRSQLATIKNPQPDTIASVIFLSTALHSVSHAIIRVHTGKYPHIINLIRHAVQTPECPRTCSLVILHSKHTALYPIAALH